MHLASRATSWEAERPRAETGCAHGAVQGKRADLREMYAEWPFFQSTIDLIEMILAKADMRIAELYDRTLVSDPAHRRLGACLRQHFHSTVDAVLQVGQPASIFSTVRCT